MPYIKRQRRKELNDKMITLLSNTPDLSEGYQRRNELYYIQFIKYLDHFQLTT